MNPQKSTMSNPARIYLLHHPDSKLAARLADRIYEWFRLPNLEGIPVYLRSRPVKGRKHPLPPDGKLADKRVQYFIPLIDAHMVRDPAWHDYLMEIATQCAASARRSPEGWGWRMFPVSLDSTAFNLPEAVSRLNFIRFGLKTSPKPVDPKNTTVEENKARKAWEESESEDVLKHLTEAFARDLNGRLFPEQAQERFQIFISYARADSTEEAKALRNYIQGQTQCLVFFDENDIGFGQAFGESLEHNAGENSKALIVINSDHYAERPWCRWEIDRFSEPRPVKLSGGSTIQVFHPMLVVEKMSGPKVSRVVPELGLAPVVRWEPGREALIFSSLMREVVMGLRDVLTARLMKWNPQSKSDLVVNRLPSPVMLAKLLRPAASGGKKTMPKVIHYPGHGLPYTELQLLRKTFSSVRFHAFRDITRALNDTMRGACESLERSHEEAPPLQGRVIVVSTAHHREDLAELGLLPQNQDEALIHLLRPLIRLGADLMYGGRPPKQNMEAAEENLAERNITLTLMRLLNSERSVEQSWPEVRSRVRRRPLGPVLFNPSSWPTCRSVTEVDEAAWINVCRVKRVMPSDAKLPEWKLDVPDSKAKGREILHGFRRHQALTMSAMRRMLAEGFPCEIPSRKQDRVQAAAFVFIGGAVDVFKGVMPGVFEEFLAAATSSSRVPIYLLGGLGGATRIIADAMLNPRKTPSSALTQSHYQSPKAINSSEYNALIAELEPGEKTAVADQFRELWRIIQSAHGKPGISGLLANGLTEAENRTLLATPNTVEAVSLVWQGLSRKFLSK